MFNEHLWTRIARIAGSRVFKEPLHDPWHPQIRAIRVPGFHESPVVEGHGTTFAMKRHVMQRKDVATRVRDAQIVVVLRYFLVAVLVRITIRQMTTNTPRLNSKLIHPGASRKNVPTAQSTSITSPAINHTSIGTYPI